MLQKLAPCGSSQKNEALHSMVITLASKSLHLGRSNSYLGRYSLAIIKMFKDNDVGAILLQQLGIEVGFYTNKQIRKKNKEKKQSQERKKKPESKLLRNKRKKERSTKNSKSEAKEELQYQSGIGINENQQPMIKKQKLSPKLNLQKRIKNSEKTDKDFPFICSIEGCTKKYKHKGSLKVHIGKIHQN
jgi:hypothetical protein